MPDDAQKQLQNFYSDLYDTLNNAYWVASTIESKDRIHGIAEAVYDILSDLDAADIKSRTEQFTQWTATVNDVNQRLTALQKDIATIIHNVQVANQVVAAATKVIGAATSFLA